MIQERTISEPTCDFRDTDLWAHIHMCEIEIDCMFFLKNYLTRMALFQFLADAGLYESHEEAIKREEVLGRLDQVVLIFELRILSLLQQSH